MVKNLINEEYRNNNNLYFIKIFTHNCNFYFDLNIVQLIKVFNISIIFKLITKITFFWKLKRLLK